MPQKSTATGMKEENRRPKENVAHGSLIWCQSQGLENTAVVGSSMAGDRKTCHSRSKPSEGDLSSSAGSHDEPGFGLNVQQGQVSKYLTSCYLPKKKLRKRYTAQKKQKI